MKLISVVLLFALMAASAFAEDSLVCYNDSSKLDVTLTDDTTISVYHAKFDSQRVEVRYKGSNKFVVVKPERTKLKDMAIVEIRLTFDQGTSVKRVYLIDWSKFEDGSTVPVKVFSSSMEDHLEMIKQMDCEAAQS